MNSGNDYRDYTPGAPSNDDRFGGGAGVFDPETYDVPDAVAQWSFLTNQFAKRFDLPARVVLAQLWQESWGDPNALSQTGAQGLMQLFPAAVDDVRHILGVPIGDWEGNPTENVKAGIAYLALQRQRAGSLEDGLRAYYEGWQPSGIYNQAANEYHDAVLDKAYKLGYLGLT